MARKVKKVLVNKPKGKANKAKPDEDAEFVPGVESESEDDDYRSSQGNSLTKISRAA
jgi:hypothetical protein